MPYVSVNFKVIVDDSYDAVVKQYNKNKPSDWQPLAKLDRIEGGFQIDLRVETETRTYRLFNRLFVDHRQHAGHGRVDQRHLRIWLGAELSGRAGE